MFETYRFNLNAKRFYKLRTADGDGPLEFQQELLALGYARRALQLSDANTPGRVELMQDAIKSTKALQNAIPILELLINRTIQYQKMGALQ